VRLDLKKSFLTGIFVIVPLVISVALLVWFFEKVDALFSPVIDGILRITVSGSEHIPGTGFLAGLVIILLGALFAGNVIRKRIPSADTLINRSRYRTIYTTIKQLTNAFSPDSTRSFKEVAGGIPEGGRFRLGSPDRGKGEEAAALFVQRQPISAKCFSSRRKTIRLT
jgi:uncharacterized membrane protein